MKRKKQLNQCDLTDYFIPTIRKIAGAVQYVLQLIHIVTYHTTGDTKRVFDMDGTLVAAVGLG